MDVSRTSTVGGGGDLLRQRRADELELAPTSFLVFLDPRRHLHGAGCRDCGGVCGNNDRAHHLIKA
jgi:hypothetical protein